MIRILLSGLAMAAMISPFPAFAQTTRVITPVDSEGNPTGPSRTIVIPDTPDSTAVVEPVDANGNPVGAPIEIPDASTEPPSSGSEPDLEPIEPEPEPEPQPEPEPSPDPESKS